MDGWGGGGEREETAGLVLKSSAQYLPCCSVPHLLVSIHIYRQGADGFDRP